MKNRRHPVRELLVHAAMGEEPTEEAMQALPVTAGRRGEVRAAVRLVLVAKEAGRKGDARAMAKEYGDKLTADLEEWAPPTADTPDDPRELASMIRREPTR